MGIVADLEIAELVSVIQLTFHEEVNRGKIMQQSIYRFHALVCFMIVGGMGIGELDAQIVDRGGDPMEHEGL